VKPVGAALTGVLMLAAGTAGARPLRILSLDQCADQYVLALAPDAELALSPRADDPDAWLRAGAAGHRRLRPTLEAAVAFQPDIVVRYWGGEPRLLTALERRGAKVATIEEATDFDGVRANIRRVGDAFAEPTRANALIARMDGKLAAAHRPPAPGRSALYLTAGGFTAGEGTLMDAILKAAGYANLAAPGFAPVSVERIALVPPLRFVLGFFEQLRADWRGAGRHPVVRRAAEGYTAASLPGAALTCPGWFAADAAAMLADGQ
jgi:iron complex transport system substrate-binding protein